MMSTTIKLKCTICGLVIDGSHIGDGDGTGQKFAHPECFYRREYHSLRARIADVEALTDKLFANFYPATLSRCRVVAEYLSKWLKEG